MRSRSHTTVGRGGTLENCACRGLDVGVSGSPRRHAQPQDNPPGHRCGTEPAPTVALHICRHSSRTPVVAESDECLVENDRRHELGAALLKEYGEGVGPLAAAVDELGNSSGPQLLDGRPCHDSACTTRILRLGHEGSDGLCCRGACGRDSLRRSWWGVRCGTTHRRVQRPAIAHCEQGRLVGTVEHLVQIRRPRICTTHTVDQASPRSVGRCGGPHPKGTIDVHPHPASATAPRSGPCDARLQIIKRAGVDVPSLENDNGRGCRRRHIHKGGSLQRAVGSRGQCSDVPTSSTAPEAHNAESLEHGAVALLAQKHRDGRRADETVCLDVPPRVPENCIPGGCKRNRVGGGAATAQHAAARGGQSKQLDQPPHCLLFEEGCGWRSGLAPSVLVPRRHEPICRQGRRQSAPCHEPKVPPAR
eukprot:m.41096 g.41096  ORF g.41096 m.41096 type:complete len:419 (+) comp14109_c0_seq1:149-1405(+)